MDPATATLTAAVITGAVALIAALIAAIVSMRNEGKRRAQEREKDRVQRAQEREKDRLASIRLSAAEVFKEMFVLQHEIEWFTWHAKYEPSAVNEHMRHAYDEAVHASIPKLLGSLAVLASLDMETYRELRPIAKNLFDIEVETAQMAIKLSDPQTKHQAVKCMGKQFSVAAALWDELPVQMAEVMNGEKPTAPVHAARSKDGQESGSSTA